MVPKQVALEEMGMAAEETICPMCGFKNEAAAERCQACGAKLEALTVTYSAEERFARRYQQESFEWRWALVSLGIFLGCELVVLAGLPRVIHAFDPQGMPGLLLSVLIWTAGGAVVGYLSPHKTFMEPAVGALLAVPPTITFLSYTTPVGFQPSVMAYIVASLIGIMMALFGAFAGERAQLLGKSG